MRTTHTGSLPRSAALIEQLDARDRGEDAPELAGLAEVAVEAVVARQLECGIDVLNDGEQGKASYATYVRHRLSGFNGEPSARVRQDRDEFPDFYASLPRLSGAATAFFPSCDGPIKLLDPQAASNDVDRLLAAAAAHGVASDRLFLSAASPGLVAGLFHNRYYPNEESYLVAIGEAMAGEYRAITDAGITVQFDCPDLAGSYSWRHRDLSIEAFRQEAARSIEVLNAVTKGIPPELMRIHICWGNYEGPHTHDVELGEIVDVLLAADPAGLSIEAANPRHAHEWRVFEDVSLPEGKYLIPGVIDTTTNFVEHPDLVADRLRNYAGVVGAERVVAGVDCGFATFAGPRAVAPTVALAKLASLVEGARRATDALA